MKNVPKKNVRSITSSQSMLDNEADHPRTAVLLTEDGKEVYRLDGLEGFMLVAQQDDPECAENEQRIRGVIASPDATETAQYVLAYLCQVIGERETVDLLGRVLRHTGSHMYILAVDTTEDSPASNVLKDLLEERGKQEKARYN